MYAEFSGDGVRPSAAPNAKESKKFVGDIWSIRKEYSREAEWLKDIKNELGNDKNLRERVVISVEKVKKQCRKIPHWIAPGKDGVQSYWIKNFSNLYERIAVEANKILMGDDSLPSWITHGCTCHKDPIKGKAVENYCPTTCFSLMLKLLTVVIAEEINDYLEQEKLLAEEKKGYRRGSRGTKRQLLIDKTELKDCKKRHTSLSMA